MQTELAAAQAGLGEAQAKAAADLEAAAEAAAAELLRVQVQAALVAIAGGEGCSNSMAGPAETGLQECHKGVMRACCTACALLFLTRSTCTPTLPPRQEEAKAEYETLLGVKRGLEEVGQGCSSCGGSLFVGGQGRPLASRSHPGCAWAVHCNQANSAVPSSMRPL